MPPIWNTGIAGIIGNQVAQQASQTIRQRHPRVLSASCYSVPSSLPCLGLNLGQPLQETMCRLVKRLCLASLAMAGWLMGMTVIGFLVAVKGPIGAAAVAFYTDLSLYCRSSVSAGSADTFNLG